MSRIDQEGERKPFYMFIDEFQDFTANEGAAKTLAQIGSAFPGSPGRWANAQFTPDGSHLVTIYDDGRALTTLARHA